MKPRAWRVFLHLLLPAALFAVVLAQEASASGNGESSTISASSVPLMPAGGVDGPGVAVVELFTSEGCSSCPPADKVISEVVADSRRLGTPVYALAWHVDYWDYLGWKDPYASRISTDRQRSYAKAFSSQLYTPQIVVNGTAVASYAGDRREVGRLISHGLEQPSRVGVQLTIRTGRSPRILHVSVATSGASQQEIISLVLVEDGLVGKPTAGENAGRTLQHSGVVRAYATLPVDGGATDLTIPARMSFGSSHLVAFVQDRSTLAIVGANSADLSSLVQSADTGPKSVSGARISGSLVGRTGSGVEGGLVQACSESLCIPGRSDATGRYNLVDVPAGDYTLKLYLPGETAEPAVTQTLTVGPGEMIFVPTVAIGS